MRNIIQTGLILGIKLECIDNDGRFLAINNNFLGAHIIEVTHGCNAGKLTSAHFLAEASFGILGKRVHVVFALPKRHVEHKFSLWRRLKPERGELQRLDLPGVHEVNELPAVDTIARKSVRMPGQDSGCLPMFNVPHHLIEQGPTGNLGRLFLNIFTDDGEILLVGKLPELRQLPVNGEHLFILHIGGLARIQKEWLRARNDIVHSSIMAAPIATKPFRICIETAMKKPKGLFGCVINISRDWRKTRDTKHHKPEQPSFCTFGQSPPPDGGGMDFSSSHGAFSHFFSFLFSEPASDPPKIARERARTVGGAPRRPDKSEICTSIKPYQNLLSQELIKIVAARERGKGEKELPPPRAVLVKR